MGNERCLATWLLVEPAEGATDRAKLGEVLVTRGLGAAWGLTVAAVEVSVLNLFPVDIAAVGSR